MDAWQLSIIVVVVLAPLVLIAVWRRPWGTDRLTFRGRPTERDWRRQLDPPAPADDH